MKTRIFVSIAFMLAVVLPAGAKQPVVVTEDAHEYTASMFTLPSTTSSSFSVSACTACNRLTFTLNGETQFFIGKSELMRNKAATARPQDLADLDLLRRF